MCLRAWKDLCTPKKEGGLGVKNMLAINQGLLLASAWMIAENPQGHLYKILKSKYFPDSPFGELLLTSQNLLSGLPFLK